MLVEVRLSQHLSLSGVVGEPEPELVVELCFVGPVRLVDCGYVVADGVHELGDFVAVRGAVAGCLGLVEVLLCSGPDGLGLGDPLGDHVWIGPCLKRRSVGGELGVAFGDGGSCCGSGILCRGTAVGGGFGHPVDGVLNSMWGEEFCQPVVQRFDQPAFLYVDVARVLDPVGEGVVARVAAPVVRLLVGPVADHLPVADAARNGAT